MPSAVDRVMNTYGMIINLDEREQKIARGKVTTFLASIDVADENQLAIEGLRYLRNAKFQ